MIGQLGYGRGKVCRRAVYGLPVVYVEADPAGFFGELRLRRAGRRLLRNGAKRLLVPEDFTRWPLLEGLSPIATGPFLRAQSAELALAMLERQGLSPEGAAVALRGERVDWAMCQAAVALCGRVRRVIIDAPRGGAELAGWLRREFGMPIIPAGELGGAAVSFRAGEERAGEPTLHLYGERPCLGELVVEGLDLAEADQKNLSLLAVLWENGRLNPQRVKIT